jgi:hypothetical protein
MHIDGIVNMQILWLVPVPLVKRNVKYNLGQNWKQLKPNFMNTKININFKAENTVMKKLIQTTFEIETIG